MIDQIELALLFIVSEKDVFQPVAWREFVESSQGKAHIYCHAKQSLHFHSILRGHQIEEKHTTVWGGFGVTLAMFALLRAAIANERLTHFMFLSESCVPIKPWNAIVNSLNADPRSRLEWASWSQMSLTHQSRRSKTIISAPFWRVHPTWMVLDRETTEFLIDHEETVDKFKEVSSSDEHAMGTILGIHGYDMSKLNRRPTTWTWWRERDHPETIHVPTPQLCEQWRNFDGFCARKFPGDWNFAKLGMHI